MRKCVIYSRVSRKENTKDLTKQKHKAYTLAEKKGFDIACTFCEVASGYADVATRKELVAALDYCLKEKICIFIVSDASRISRSIRDGILILDWLHRHGISVFISKDDTMAGEAHYLDLMQELLYAERFYHGQLATGAYGFIKGRTPKGYIRNSKNKNILEADPAFMHRYQSFFLEAVKLKKSGQKQNIADIARILERDFSDLGKKRSLRSILSNPIYAGYQVSDAELKTGDIKLFPKIHYSYISTDDYLLLNSCKAQSPLRYASMLLCRQCTRHLEKQQHRFVCPRCKKSVTIKNFLEKAQDMCRQYIFDPDEILESRFTRIHLVEKASSIIMGIAQGTNPVDFGTTSDSKQTTLGEQWKEMQQAMKPSLNINVHDVALHFAIRKEINDQGESLRELIEYCFERLLIDFDNRDILTSPQKLCNHVVKAKNPVSHSCLEEDLQKIKSFANSKLAVMRRILDENPFLTDYFSYRIVSDAFKQWDDLQTFLFDIMRFEVLN